MDCERGALLWGVPFFVSQGGGVAVLGDPAIPAIPLPTAEGEMIEGLTGQNESATIANRTLVQVSHQTLKLLRRLQHLQSGRHEVLITVDDEGDVEDWSVRSWGKVER